MKDSAWSKQDHEWVEVAAIGLSGGLVLSWDKDLLHDFEVVKSHHWIWVRGSVNNNTINLVNVYGPLPL